MSSPAIKTTTNTFLVLLPTTHASFDASPPASPTTASAITETIATVLPTAELRRSSSSASATPGTFDGTVAPAAADVEPAVVMPSFGKIGFLKLGN